MAAGVQKTVTPQGMGAGRYWLGHREPNVVAEHVTLLPTTVALDAGTVLGKVTASGKYKPLDPAASDGSQNWAGFLFNPAPISTGDQRVVADVRGPGHLNANLLVWAVAANSTQKAAALAQASTAGLQAR